MYEVELKFPLADPQPVVARLMEWGAQRSDAIEQADLYFRHPSRDFEQTDEALRLRSSGAANRVTYKGPIIDSRTKMRREIEVPVGEGAEAARQFGEILEALGFHPVRRVAKRRTIWQLRRENREFEFAFDDVADLGSFLEIEALADEAGRNAARDAILALAAELGLTQSIRESYLALLLQRDRRIS